MIKRWSSYRRRLLINPAFQIRFVLYVVGISAVGFAIIFSTNLSYFAELSRMGAEMGLQESHPYFALIEEQKQKLVKSFWTAIALAVPLVLTASFILSHKIAAPIIKVQRHMRQFRSDLEHLPPFQLSDKDFFPELEDIVNRAIADFTEQMDAMNKSLQEQAQKEATRSEDPENYR